MLAVLSKYVLELKSKRFMPTRYPPSIPIESPMAISAGSESVAARTLGTTKYFIGLVESVVNASNCSVTFIVPISAAIEMMHSSWLHAETMKITQGTLYVRGMVNASLGQLEVKADGSIDGNGGTNYTTTSTGLSSAGPGAPTKFQRVQNAVGTKKRAERARADLVRTHPLLASAKSRR